MEVTLDKFLDGKIQILQPKDGYRAGIEPIFLAASVHPKDKQRILDAGSGVGTASIILKIRNRETNVIGIEIQYNLLTFSRMNALLNYIDSNSLGVFYMIQKNILSLPECLKDSYDQVMTNPPFFESHNTQASPDREKSICRMEATTIKDWIDACFKVLKPKGTFTIIHRAERMGDILGALHHIAGDIVIYPLWPGIDKPMTHMNVIIQCRKGTKGKLRFSQGMTLHGTDTQYTLEAEDVLRGRKTIIL